MWGHNGYGQLGLGDNNLRNTPQPLTTLPTNKRVTALSCGYYHTAALLGLSLLLYIINKRRLTGALHVGLQ